MKANYGNGPGGPVNLAKLRKETQAIAERLVREREDAIIAAVQTSIMQQVLAVTFWILHRDEGWGPARLNRLKDGIEDEFVLMHKKPMGREYTPLDIRAKLKEYGVDLEETHYKGGID